MPQKGKKKSKSGDSGESSGSESRSLKGSSDSSESSISNQEQIAQMGNIHVEDDLNILNRVDNIRDLDLDDLDIQQPDLRRDPVEPTPGTLQDRLTTDPNVDPRRVPKGAYMSIPRDRFRESGVTIGDDIRFSAQEKSDGRDTYLDKDGKTNLETLDRDQIAGLNVSADGRLAIESEAGDRQAKSFFIDKSILDGCNKDLAKVNSKFRLVESGGKITVPIANSNKTREIVQVVAENQKDGTRGDDVTGVENCDGMAAQVTGWDVDGNSRLVAEGKKQETRIGETYTGTRGAAFFNEYARRRERGDLTGKTKAAGKKAEFNPNRAPALQEHSHQILVRGEGEDWRKTAATWLNNDVHIPGSPYFDEEKVALMVVASDSQREQMLDECEDQGLTIEVVQTFTKDIDPGRAAHDLVAADQLDDIAKTYMELDPKTKDKVAKELKMNQYCDPKVGDAFGIFASGGVRANQRKNFGNAGQTEAVTWGQHWGGVVAASGGAFVTLENYDRQAEDRSSQERRSANATETRVFFRMYGSVPEQNWHDKNMEGGNFQNPISMVFRNKDRK